MSNRDIEPEGCLESSSAVVVIITISLENYWLRKKNVWTTIQYIQLKTPKELVREYKTHEGGKTREIGPIVYGYSVTIGPDGKLKVRELGNIRHSRRAGMFGEDSSNNDAPAAEELQITAESR